MLVPSEPPPSTLYTTSRAFLTAILHVAPCKPQTARFYLWQTSSTMKPSSRESFQLWATRADSSTMPVLHPRFSSKGSGPTKNNWNFKSASLYLEINMFPRICTNLTSACRECTVGRRFSSRALRGECCFSLCRQLWTYQNIIWLFGIINNSLLADGLAVGGLEVAILIRAWHRTGRATLVLGTRTNYASILDFCLEQIDGDCRKENWDSNAFMILVMGRWTGCASWGGYILTSIANRPNNGRS